MSRTRRGTGPSSPDRVGTPRAGGGAGILGGAFETLLGGAAVLVLLFLIWLGSNRLDNFDSALIGYAAGISALVFAVVVRYARWLRMPATRRYWRRGWQLVRDRDAFRALPTLLPRAVFGQLLGQGFILRRGVWRWVGHQCLFWGVIVSTLITFPLVFGWLAFKHEAGTETIYRMHVFGFPTITFDSASFLGWSLFHALNYTAVLVIVGAVIFIVRRLRDRGVMSGQRVGYDFAPLIALLIISVTGILLTISAMFYRGAYYDALVIIHMAAVVLSLVFIPYGKFFHVLQRPASVGIQMYTEVNARVEPASCARCGEPLASQVFVDDLRQTLLELGQDYSLPGAGTADPETTAGATADDGATPGAIPGAPPDAPRDATPGAPPDATPGAPPDATPRAATHLQQLCSRCKRELRGAAYFATNGARIS